VGAGRGDKKKSCPTRRMQRCRAPDTCHTHVTPFEGSAPAIPLPLCSVSTSCPAESCRLDCVIVSCMCSTKGFVSYGGLTHVGFPSPHLIRLVSNYHSPLSVSLSLSRHDVSEFQPQPYCTGCGVWGASQPQKGREFDLCSDTHTPVVVRPHNQGQLHHSSGPQQRLQKHPRGGAHPLRPKALAHDGDKGAAGGWATPGP
jgi:hypothetical protein